MSERARALMAQAYRDGGFPHAAGTLEAGVIDSVDSCALRALEQALTQQQATTPQPSADAVRELVERWRSNGHPYVSDCADELESLLSGGSHA